MISCLKFQKNAGVRRLSVFTEDENGNQDIQWTETARLDFWEKGQVLIRKAENFKVLVVAEHGETYDGYVAMDDFKFVAVSHPVDCEIKPGPVPTSTSQGRDTHDDILYYQIFGKVN